MNNVLNAQSRWNNLKLPKSRVEYKLLNFLIFSPQSVCLKFYTNGLYGLPRGIELENDLSITECLKLSTVIESPLYAWLSQFSNAYTQIGIVPDPNVNVFQNRFFVHPALYVVVTFSREPIHVTRVGNIRKNKYTTYGRSAWGRRPRRREEWKRKNRARTLLYSKCATTSGVAFMLLHILYVRIQCDSKELV